MPKEKKKEIIDIKLPSPSTFRIPGVPLYIVWCKEVGDHVEPGDTIAYLHSSKHDTTYEIEGEGIVLSTYFVDMRQHIDIELSPTMPAGTIVELCDGDSESEDAEDSDGEYVEKGDVKLGDIICKIQPDDDTNTPKN